MGSLETTTGAASEPHTEVSAESERVQLARVALGAALSVRGVVHGDSGPLHTHLTRARGSEPLTGVVCAAVEDGGYEVALRLVSGMVPLPALAQTVIYEVWAAARTSGLQGALRRVSVHFADIEPGPPSP